MRPHPIAVILFLLLAIPLALADERPVTIAVIDSQRVMRQVRDLLIDAGDTRVLANSFYAVQQERRRVSTELAVASTAVATSTVKAEIEESKVREQLVRERLCGVQNTEQQLNQELELAISAAFSDFLREFSADRYAAVLERREVRDFNLLAGDLAQEDATQALIEYIRGGAKLSRK